jgi:hypothetical protein
MSWQLRHIFLYTFALYGWFPHYLYIKNLYKRIHKIYLMRGGKYCRVVCNLITGQQTITWITIKDMHLLSKDGKRFDDTYEFLNKEGQLKHELPIEMDYFAYKGTPHNNEVIYLMKEGIVHQPEILDSVVRGYNIDDTDYEINTEDNIRWMEPNKNF